MVASTPLRLGALLVLLLAACASPSARPDDGPPTPSSPGAPTTGRTTSSPTPSQAASERAKPAGFQASTRRIGPDLAARMRTSHRDGCPVPLSELRYLRLTHVGLDGRDHVGELVVRARWADPVVGVFATLYDARWPIERMRLVDDYGGDDDASMADDNSSGFNCRPVADTDRWSAHAFGEAIDLNPLLNPYVRGDRVDPPAGRPYADLDRSAGADLRAGVIHADDVVVRAFAAIGWEWGGDWTSSKDYQHFSAPGE